MKKKDKHPKFIIGWREWAQLPELGIDEIKVKIDTGAKTSSIHAFEISTLTYMGKEFVKFDIHPLQDNDDVIHTCVHPILDYRWITSSTGHSQKRFIIQTILKIGNFSSLIELSLAKRDEMGFRMLVGRNALNKKVLVDPSHSFLLTPMNMLTKK
jgi:ribosomal protein S6--L-glutamate ligase